jgi:hypothetical protein
VLAGARCRCHWVSLGGALGGLLEAVGRDLPQPYVMGASGHAFRLTLDLVISQSAPVELNFHEVFPLWENLGLWFKRVAARPADENYTATRAEVLERMREAIDQGRPVISFDLLGLPEYGLAVGYDGDRLACLTLNNDEEPAWMETADWPPEVHRQFTRAEAITVLDVAPDFDRRRAETASLRFAVEHFWAPSSRDSWLMHGVNAYQFWAATLASSLPLHGVNPGVGHSYNLMVLQRARRDAAAYLAELAGRYPEAPSLAAAAARYGEVAAIVEEGTQLLPFPGMSGLEVPETRKGLADVLRRAMAAERQGVDEIEKALRALR